MMMKVLRRSSTSSSSSSSSSPRTPSSPLPPPSSWIHRRSLMLVASSSSSLGASGKSAAAAPGSASALLAADPSSPSRASSSPNSDRGGIKSPWSRRKRKRALSCQHWSRLFSANGKLRDGGRKFLKKVRSGGIEPGIRAEVWPFLLGVCGNDLLNDADTGMFVSFFGLLICGNHPPNCVQTVLEEKNVRGTN